MRSRTFLFAPLTLAAAALVLGGCAGTTPEPEAPDPAATATGEWAETIAAAEEEGVVSVYSILVPAVNTLIEQEFEKAYPNIDVQIVRVLGNEIDAKLTAERDTNAPTADLVINANYDTMLKYAADGDLYEAEGPNATSEAWVESGGLIDNAIQMTAVTGIVMAWNTQIVDDPPSDLKDFLDDRFSGLIGVPNNDNLALASFWAFLNDQEDGYWDALAEQKPQVYASAVPLQEALVSGEIGVTFYSVPAIIDPVKQQGAPVDWAASSPIWGPQTLSYMPNWNSAHPAAAQVLFDWLGSEAGQEVVGANNISVLDVPGTLQPFADTSIVDFDTQLDPAWVSEQQGEWRTTFGR